MCCVCHWEVLRCFNIFIHFSFKVRTNYRYGYFQFVSVVLVMTICEIRQCALLSLATGSVQVGISLASRKYVRSCATCVSLQILNNLTPSCGGVGLLLLVNDVWRLLVLMLLPWERIWRTYKRFEYSLTYFGEFITDAVVLLLNVDTTNVIERSLTA